MFAFASFVSRFLIRPVSIAQFIAPGETHSQGVAGAPAYAGSSSGSPKRPKKSTKRSGIIGSSGQRL